ncbi:MAG TPA: Na+/H+ antiporter NhaA, partial [Azospirillaceae bacterium]|nr:Na+/H+ antiporter NhaA [Azospirillaceae bacterium]
MLKAIQNFMRLEASGGILLAVAGGVALVLSNSPLAHQYDRLIETPVMLQIGGLVLAKSLLHWINDGLMA